MHRLRRATAAIAVGGMVIIGAATTAGADPKGEVVELHCGGAHYTVVTAGNGEFTPAHDVRSNRVFIPVAFGDFTGTITDLTANTTETFTEEGPIRKGNAKARGRTLMECTYTFMDEFVAQPGDEGLVAGHLYRFEGRGEVTLFASGPKR